MKKVNPLLGRKRSPEFGRKVSQGLARAKAAGRWIGTPRIHPIVHSVCETCEKNFVWTRGQYEGMSHQTTGRFCSKRCLVRWLHKYRQLLPHAIEIKRLYWEEGKSLWEIARMFGVTDACTVRKAMIKGGITRRAKKHLGKAICIVKDCKKPTFKIKHKNNGAMYGKRCREHWNKHRAALQKKYVAAKPEQRARRIAYSRDYYRRTREQRLAYMREYRKNHETNAEQLAA